MIAGVARFIAMLEVTNLFSHFLAHLRDGATALSGHIVSDEYNARTSGTMSGQCMSTVIRSTPLSSQRQKTYVAFVCIGKSRCRHMPQLSQVWVFFMQNGSSFQECWKVIE